MSDTITSKIVKVLSWVLMGISVLFAILFYTGSIDPEPFIIWAYILFGLAVLLALVFPLYFFIRNPKNALKTLLGLGVMAVFFVVGYFLADPTPIYSPTNNPDLSNHAVLVISDTGIIATYLMFGVALLLLLYTGIRGIFNR